MNRDLKFRAWYKNNEEMCEVISLQKPHVVVSCIDRSTIYMSGEQPMTHKLLNSDKVELMEYTGLNDKDGKPIYEGDIIKIKHPYKNRYYKGEIIFENGAFEAKGFNFPHYDNPNDFKEGLEYVEVIGNIYENPELLK